jgi:hypothetical protein
MKTKYNLPTLQKHRARALRRLFGDGSRFVLPGDPRHAAFIRIIDRWMENGRRDWRELNERIKAKREEAAHA